MPGARVCICPSEGAAALSLLVSEHERSGCHRQVMEMVREWKGALGTHAGAGAAHRVAGAVCLMPRGSASVSFIEDYPAVYSGPQQLLSVVWLSS